MKPHKFADIFPMMDSIDFENLKKDIKENGFDETRPIILYEGEILDGRNRDKACKEVGIKPVYENYKGDNPLLFVISTNLDRRHLTPSQRAVIAVEVMPLLEQQAKERQTLGKKLPEVEKGRAKDIAADKFHTNREYIRIAEKLKPEVLEEIKQGRKDFSEVKKEERLEKIKTQRAEIETNTKTSKPTGKYDVIAIDPPWDYGNDENYNPDSFRGTCPYPVMSFEDIKNIKLPAEDNCVLWLWTTNKFMLQMQELLDAWGFEFKTILTWDKEHIAIGKWLRSQTEHCILAIKGKPFYNNTKWGTLIREKRTEHSAKPEIFYKMVDEICAGRKLDYFARKKREGWDVYGDEVK